ncbi:DUF5671 domain-containing protein [Dehalococcoidia bacterium]|nr:DUF5671 domain-containing protein [Dehalococcoidia bacterium]
MLEFISIGIFPLILLFIVGLVVFLVTAKRRGNHDLDPGIGTMKRLYFYSVIFVALMMTANGIMLVVMDLLENLSEKTVVASSSTQLAWGLALVIVGLPLWYLHRRTVQRHMAELLVERNSILRKLFTYVTLGVSISLLTLGAIGITEWVLGVREFSGFSWAAVIVWSGVWWFHWRIEESEGQHTIETRGIRRLYLYLVVIVTITMLAIGAALLMHYVLVAGYASAFSGSVLRPDGPGLWTVPMRDSVSMALVGGVIWSAHWFRFASRDQRSDMRWAYLYLFSILGGTVTALAATGVIINRVVETLLAVHGSTLAVMHYDVLPSAIASLSVGAAVWFYHWWTVQRETAGSVAQAVWAKRTYVYLLSLLGLATLAAASITVINTALELISERSRVLVSGGDVWREPTALAVTLIVIGGPVWWYYWRQVRRLIESNGATERSAFARRLFTFVVLGLGLLAALGSVSGTMFVLLRDILDAGVSMNTLRDIRPALSVVVTAGIILPYHWSVYLTDRAAEPPVIKQGSTSRTSKQVSLLVPEGSAKLISEVEQALGQRVKVLNWTDTEAVVPLLTEQEFFGLANRVADAVGNSVILVPHGGDIRVLSYK